MSCETSNGHSFESVFHKIRKIQEIEFAPSISFELSEVGEVCTGCPPIGFSREFFLLNPFDWFYSYNVIIKLSPE